MEIGEACIQLQFAARAVLKLQAVETACDRGFGNYFSFPGRVDPALKPNATGMPAAKRMHATAGINSRT
jgi:hypothetical protein